MANFCENDAVVSGGNAEVTAGNFWEADSVVQAKPEAWNPVLGLSRDLVNGIPILGPAYTGAVDAITTNISGMPTGEDPQAIKDRVYARQDQYEAENPILSATGQMVGGTLATGPSRPRQPVPRLSVSAMELSCLDWPRQEPRISASRQRTLLLEAMICRPRH